MMGKKSSSSRDEDVFESIFLSQTPDCIAAYIVFVDG